jgi:homoserine O-acetyltransferase
VVIWRRKDANEKFSVSNRRKNSGRESGYIDLGCFEFECGEQIPQLTVSYETYGEFSGDNAVLVCHALTASDKVTCGPDEKSDQGSGWWNDIVGPGKAIDTDKFFVICVNVPGSCYGTTGPKSVNPATGERYGPDFPQVTVGDWVEVQKRCIERLGVNNLHAVVGGSVGGFNVLEWAKRFPDKVEKMIPIATGPHLDPQCLALSSISRRAIKSDENWKGGEYYSGDSPVQGLALARQIGHVMYLSKDSMDQKFGRKTSDREDIPDLFGIQDGETQELENYLDYNAKKFVERFDANSYIILSRAMENYELSRGFRNAKEALKDFEGEALIISFTGDWHFTPEQSEGIHQNLKEVGVDSRHKKVESEYGHDAFLVETEKIEGAISKFLKEKQAVVNHQRTS